MSHTPQPAPAPGVTAVGLATSAHVVVDAYGNVYPALVPLVAASLGFGLVSGSLVITGVGVASSVLQPVFGALSDRRGSTLLAPVALGVVALSTALLGFVHDAAMFLVLAVIAGIANGAFHPPSLSLVRSAAGGRPGRYTSIFFMGGTLGRAAGPVLMVACAAVLGLRGLAVLAAPGLLLALGLAAQAQRRGGMEGRTAARAQAVAVPAPGPSTASLIRRRLMPMALVVFIAVTGGTATSAISTFWPLLHHHTVAALFGSSAVIGVMMLAGSVGTVVGGSASDRLPNHLVLAATSIASALSLGAFALAQGAWIYPFAALAGFFGMSGFAVTTVMGQNLIPERVAMASGLAFGVSNAVTSGAVALLAVAASVWGGPTALVIAAAVCLCGLPAALAYPWVVERRGGGVAAERAAAAAT